MKYLYQRSSINSMSKEVEASCFKLQQLRLTSSYVEPIKLTLMVQVICNHFLIEENDSLLLSRQHESQKFFFLIRQFPLKNFDDDDDDATLL